METSFIFTACKYGFEHQCKKEVLGFAKNLRFAYSRPGFLTFKVVEGSVDFSTLNSLTFVRLAGSSPIQLNSSDRITQLQDFVESFSREISFRHLHIWNRNLGDLTDSVRLEFVNGESNTIPEAFTEFGQARSMTLNQRAKMNDAVLNVIEVDEDKYWAAVHRVETPNQCWPGGIIRFPVSSKVVSRAYYKAQESMAWCRFPMKENEVCIEIGSAPGGAAQALLEKGLVVKGIDPAEMDEFVASHPNFEHIKKRGADVKKKDLADAKWLFADSNVAPNHTLDTVEGIVTNQHIHINGLILTLKLMQGKLGDEIDEYRKRIRDMGFKYVKSKQLAFNRNEVCVVALKRKSILRFGKIRDKKK